MTSQNTRPQPSAEPVDELIEPLFSCSREGCREECSYPADMLRLHNGKPICDDCYCYLPFKEQAPDPDNEEETLMWGELPPFVPPFAARIAALEVQLADAKTALIATGEATATHLKRATALEADKARLRGLVETAAAAERARIVAWLRDQAPRSGVWVHQDHFDDLANAIDQGLHIDADAIERREV